MTLQDTAIARSLSLAGSDAPDIVPGGEFINRETSWLEFNRRVLHEALDQRTPLLERVGFLAIFNSNLDEYYQKRVGGLKRQIQAGVSTRSPDGLSPRETLARIRETVLELLETQRRCYLEDVHPALTEQGIHLLTWHELTDAERDYASQYFRKNLFPVLTPLAVDPGHPFPFISNLSTSLGISLRHPAAAPLAHGRRRDDHDARDERGVQFARVKVPAGFPQWIRLSPGPDPDVGPFRFVRLREIIRHNLDDLFPGMIIEDVMPFRVTRNADVERDEEDAEDLLELIEQELRDRRFARAVRLEIGAEPDARMVQLLKEELQLDDSDVYHMPDILDYTALWAIHDVPLPQLKYEPWTPTVPPRLADEEADIFSVIRAGDVMVHHPYESFSASVERFIAAAVNDPKVYAIKLTLYRTSEDSPFIPLLIRAAEAGKQVVCLVELKARFDEERNIRVAQKLEKAGVHVVYGIIGLKTHTKTSIVVRQEADGMRTYAHIGTGNYHPKTANLYTDLGLFTADTRLTDEMVELFHYLTGHSRKHDFRHLLIAPVSMRERFTQMIDREIEHASVWRAGSACSGRTEGAPDIDADDDDDPDRPLIIAKMNSLEDQRICRKLYEASQAGVRVKLIVRGFCCLRPGAAGLSENITVQSVIGRFLEHSRIFYFHNAGQPEYYIGSADWMYRNLNNRVECTAPILAPAHQQRLKHILDTMLADHRQAWDMQADGSYVRRRPQDPEAPHAAGTHQTLMEQARRDAAAGG